MDFNATVDLIIKDLNEAREIIDDLKNYPGVSVLQVELAKSKCKSAGELIALLKNLKPETRHTSADIKTKAPDRTSDKSSESTIIADTFGLTDRINEQIGSLRGDENVTDIIKTKHLTNLADAIGVNDKFLFIRELFNGSPESYNQAIARLDSAESFADAQEVLMSYTGDNKETEVLKQLIDLVKRKFHTDE